jgi:murein DD-endopeptidase MepM/ murein hydrolase activator NlpD
MDLIRKGVKLLVALLLSTFLLSQYVGSLLTDQRVSLELEILDLKSEINSRDASLIETQEAYTNTIKTIVENIRLTDSYMFTGGSSYTDTEFNLEMYESILTMDNDFNGLLSFTENFFDSRSKYLADIPNIFPVPYSSDNIITSLFGSRISPITGKIVEHNGIDIMSSFGTRIIATASGVVKAYYPNHWLYGRYLIIKHIDGYESHYAHLDKNYVRRDDKVLQGDIIGLMGNSGRSSGIHLHYMVTKDGVPQNPIFYIRKNK